MTAPLPAIRSLDDLREGDLMLTGMSGAPAKAVVYAGQAMLGEYVRIGRLKVGHIAMVSRAPRHEVGSNTYAPAYLVEAMPGGARQRQVRPSDWSPATAFVRLPTDYDGQHLDAARLAVRMIGIPYSFGSYGALAAWRWGIKAEHLAEWIDRRQGKPFEFTDARGVTRPEPLDLPAEAICSVLADQAWTLAGKRVVVGTRSQIVTPGMLALSLWRRPGAVWGGEGILG